METKIIDGCGCCGGCPGDCSGCGETLTAGITGPGGPGCCDATGSVRLTRSGCIWWGTQYFQGNCVVVSVVVACDPADGLWRITIELSSCCVNRDMSSIYQSPGRSGSCPPKGSWTLNQTSGATLGAPSSGCGGQLQVNLQ